MFYGSCRAAQLRLCADGGANRLFDEMPELFPLEDPSDVRNRYWPDVIKGDMDSIRAEVLDFYSNLDYPDVALASVGCMPQARRAREDGWYTSTASSRTDNSNSAHVRGGGLDIVGHMLSKLAESNNIPFEFLAAAMFCSKVELDDLGGSKILDESHDQDTTDLHKCVAYIRDFTQNDDSNNICILVAGALGGRFDHEIGNINVLCRFSSTRIVLLSEDCLIQLLPRTHHHEIHILSSVEGPHCGLIPIGMPSASTTTTGLQWDLNNAEMEFGGLVSTSNVVREEKITVQSDSHLLWTISIQKQI
ncbi:hypothetical protein GIB67_015110 [Kingdonia uniflora]|uniref:Thiamine pyrophosphokinase n=1 Tax=Kingdonia uniflora TaxID=39325 RepID=A0A7J7LJC4_9MAGN|nr:hypothetical protein GIB67_015110 [Kingdonia uniflora]